MSLPGPHSQVSLVDPCSVSSLLACHLIALDKNPGVRSISIGETARRIIAKAVLAVTRPKQWDLSSFVRAKLLELIQLFMRCGIASCRMELRPLFLLMPAMLSILSTTTLLSLTSAMSVLQFQQSSPILQGLNRSLHGWRPPTIPRGHHTR